jgi:hypothetical protein
MAGVILRIAVVAVVIVAALLIYAATKPDQIGIERSASIHAPPEKIAGLITDFHHWKAWAPQDRDDPTMMRTFTGAQNGVGAISTWTSKGDAGKGKMEITAASPTSVEVTVDFQAPLRAHNINTFTFVPHGSETNVVWKMRGTNPYMAKVMGVFVNMDRMMGRHFEMGLANLKSAAEN